jgi:toxin secretion/phage lysis holin
MEQINRFKATVTGIFGAISVMLGWFGWMVFLYIVAMVLDWITGVAVAKCHGEWSSKAAREGCWHKFGSVTAILVALMFDGMIAVILQKAPGISLPFAYSVLLGPVVLAWYIVTELGSIIENVGQLGVPIPSFLVKAIKILNTSVEQAGEQLSLSPDQSSSSNSAESNTGH